MFLVYGKENCKFCTSAKELLIKNGDAFSYFTLDQEYTKQELIEVCEPVVPRTLPQIFFMDDDSTKSQEMTYIGGYTELCAFLR